MPQKPTTEPTDRSMPPLRMTNVMPIARIALMATCLTRIERLPVVRNSGDSSEKTSVTTREGDEARGGAATLDPSSRDSAHRRAPPLAGRRRRRRRERLVGHVRPRQIGGDPAARHHERRASPRRCISARSDVANTTADAVGRQPPHRLDNLAPSRRRPRRAWVRPSAARAAGVMTLRAITTFCWLPPLSAPIGGIERRRLDAQAASPIRRPPPASRAGER